jgi:hypothetical protein
LSLRNEEWLSSEGYYDPYLSEYIAIGKLLEEIKLKELCITIGFAGGTWEVVIANKGKAVRGKSINLLDALTDAYKLATSRT